MNSKSINHKVFNLEQILAEAGITETSPRRDNGRRSPTTLKLQWLAERVRKCDRIKRQISAGAYYVDSTDVARAILSVDEPKAKANSN